LSEGAGVEPADEEVDVAMVFVAGSEVPLAEVIMIALPILLLLLVV
jgi:hypothetical protein